MIQFAPPVSTAETHPPVFSIEPEQQPEAFYRQAESLWADGHELAAVVMARVALETHLLAMCIESDRVCNCCTRYNSATYRERLFDAGLIDPATDGKIRQIFRTSSRAAHGRPVSYNALANVMHCVRSVVAPVAVVEGGVA